MSVPEHADEVTDELRRFRERLPQWVDELRGLAACGEAAGGSVRATGLASGTIASVHIDTRFLRRARPGQVDAAILEALQGAQVAASKLVRAHQERLRFMDLPIGEVLSGKRRFTDLFPPSFKVSGNADER